MENPGDLQELFIDRNYLRFSPAQKRALKDEMYTLYAFAPGSGRLPRAEWEKLFDEINGRVVVEVFNGRGYTASFTRHTVDSINRVVRRYPALRNDYDNLFRSVSPLVNDDMIGDAFRRI